MREHTDARLEALPTAAGEEDLDAESREAFEQAYAEWLKPARWDPDSFSHEQIRSLVRQVFSPGWPRAARQVVICAVDAEVEVAPICAEIGETLAEQLNAGTCLVEANWRAPGLERFYGRNRNDGLSAPETADAMRKSSRQISRHLHLESWEVPLGGCGFSAAWLRSQLGELRRQFEYLVIHAPPAGSYCETAELGNLTDGVILVLEAHTTRRAAAQQAKDTLLAANAHLLGTVLSERRFPIPEQLYRRL